MNRDIHIDSRYKQGKFKFNDSFLEMFKSAIDALDKSMDKLHDIPNLIDNESVYGICNCSYKIRYITPSDVSTYVANLEKAFKNNLLRPNIGDCEMFAVASAKRFIEEHGCVPFESSSIMGNNKQILPKSYTLKDLLLLCDNDVYSLNVYSKYELDKRVKTMENDIKIIEDLHFVSNMKNIVNALPEVISRLTSNDEYSIFNDMMFNKAFTMFIEEFILFACMLNTITVDSMIAYAVPSSNYKTSILPVKESDNDDDVDELENDLFIESINTTKKSLVLLCLSEGHTRFISQAIKTVTHSKFSHISISFDPDMRTMYSFGGKVVKGTYTNDSDGCRKEDITDECYDDINVNIFGIYLDKDKVLKMKNTCEEFIKHDTNFSYGLLLKKLIGNDKTGSDRYSQVCSTFVNMLLNDVGVNIVDNLLPSPADMYNSFMTKENQVFELYYGLAHEYNEKDIRSKLSKCVSDNKSFAIDEVVTECCLLKTNEFTINSKIPFNCNMRDIVLQESNPLFNDTMAALEFILNDDRSPIHILLTKYADKNETSSPDMIIKMFNGREIMDDSALEQRYRDFDFHTDVDWLDKIAYGNNYLDGNYRRDVVGNNKFNSIENTLEMMYRMFGGCCEDCDNTSLANNIINVGNTMKAIITAYRYNRIENWHLVEDILAVLGEIFTRNMLKLYHNNTRCIAASMNMEDTMTPGYMYCESFIMEADNNNNNAPTVSIDNGNGNGGNGQNKNIGNTIINKIRQFSDWITKQIQQFAVNFNKNHKSETEWVYKNTDLNNKITQALTNQSFKPTITNFPNFNVAGEDISNIKVADIVKAELAKTDEIDPVNIKAQLYPGGQAIAKQIAQLNDAKKEADALRNYILYKNINPTNTTSTGPLTAEQWKDLVSNLTGTGKVIENSVKSMSDSLKRAAQDLDIRVKQDEREAKMKKTESENNNNNQQQQPNATVENNTNVGGESRAKQLFDIVQSVSNTYYTTTLNSLVKNFYGTSYNLYRDIVTAYNQQIKNNNNSNGTNTPNATNNGNTTNGGNNANNNTNGESTGDSVAPPPQG